MVPLSVDNKFSLAYLFLIDEKEVFCLKESDDTLWGYEVFCIIAGRAEQIDWV